jgi:WD40 repeat protein
MEGHHFTIGRVAVSRDRKFIASGDDGGEIITWNRHGKALTIPIKVHSVVNLLDFSPDGTLLASGLMDTTVEFWNTKTWQVQGNTIITKIAHPRPNNT